MQASGNGTWSSNPEISILYCHQRVSPTGHIRLVVIQSPSYDIGQLLVDSMSAYVYETVWPAWHEGSGTENRLEFQRSASPPAEGRFFVGQSDSKDASHFTIEYQWPNGVSGMIDGYLRDDDSVDLSVRPGPGDIVSEEKRAFGP